MKSKRRVTKRRKRTRMHGGAAADSAVRITDAFNGSLSGVKEEIENGQNINEVKIKTTDLIDASVKGDINRVNHLLENGADPNVETNSVFKYALTWAAFHNKLEVMESLINFDYKDDLKKIEVDKASMTNRTPLMIVIDNIVKNRDNIDNIDNKDLKKIQKSFYIIILLLEKGADVNKADESNQTAVTRAIRKREIINNLRKKRADVNKADDSNHTAVNQAIHMMDDIIFILQNREAIESHKAPNAYLGKDNSTSTTSLLPNNYTSLNRVPLINN